MSDAVRISNSVQLNATPNRPRVIAVTSGKGGVGKTSISVNLAIALARTSSRVCLFDADMSLANVNIMLGQAPEFTLEHVLTGEKELTDILMEGPKGIRIVPAASGFVHCLDWESEQQSRLIHSLRQLEPRFEYIIIDTAAGISPNVLHFIGAAQLATVVITPEPTSLTDAFSLLKALKRRGYKRQVQIILNMAQDARSAGRIYRRFEAAVAKYLGLKTEFMGSVWADSAMSRAVTNQRPVTLLPTSDPSCRTFFRLAKRMMEVFDQQEVARHSFSAYWERLVRNQKAKSPASKAPAPVTEATESRWSQTRASLNRFLNDSDTTPEQIAELMTLCLERFRKAEGTAITDVGLKLIGLLDPEQVTASQGEKLARELVRLTRKPLDPALFSGERHRFAEEDFGNQEQLLARIRASNGQSSLNHLLESMKLASLTGNSD